MLVSENISLRLVMFEILKPLILVITFRNKVSPVFLICMTVHVIYEKVKQRH